MNKALERGQSQLDAIDVARIDIVSLAMVPTAAAANASLLEDASVDAANKDGLVVESDDARIKRLALMSSVTYEREREEQAKQMGIRVTALDKEVQAIRGGAKSVIDTPFEEVDVWPYPVDLAVLLSEIAATVLRFIVCEPHTAHIVALWVAMTWVIDVVKVAPLAVITAPEKRCGKSQLLFLLANIVKRPLETSNISTAALFRGIELWKPTLLIDEVDTFVKNNEDLRGAINAGHTPKGCIWRTVGDDHTPTRFNVFGAKALAGIGKLDGTIMDRSIILELRRKLPSESVERLRHADAGLFEKIASKLARFAEDCSDTISQARPELPDELNDRAQDNWEALLAIADIAGNGWPEMARKAARKLSRDDEQSQGIGIELLADIQEIFEQKNVDRITSADLITALCSDDEKPWLTYNRGFPIKPRQVVGRLREFGVVSNTIRSFGNKTAKGFLRAQFADPFARYLTPPENTDVSVTPSQAMLDAEVAVTEGLTVTATSVKTNLSVTSKQSVFAGCDGVTDSDVVSTAPARTTKKVTL